MSRIEELFRSGETVRVNLVPNNPEFCLRQPQIVEMYTLAFENFPWYESLTPEEVRHRVQVDVEKPGFRAFVATKEGKVVGAHWSDTPTLAQLTAQRGSQLGRFIGNNFPQGLPIVWERELMVRPGEQGNGIGTALRRNFLNYLGTQYRGGALVVTRMRDDNAPTLITASRCGFLDTTIRIPSSQNPDIAHGYYVKPVNFRL